MFGSKNYLFSFFLVLSALSCDSEDSPNIDVITLSSVLLDRESVPDNVIACAASNEDSKTVSVFLYPREGATNISYYETESLDLDKNDFSLYTKRTGNLIDVFNGYLLKYEITPEQEKWLIVTFEEEGKIHLSNPIRLKQNSKPTEYLPENIMVQPKGTMPAFTWVDGMFKDSKIYFHVVSNENDDLLSGTYTFDKFFQYYKLDNVVLNITEEEPPTLEIGPNYNFTLLAVSEDNWVNLFSIVPFHIP